MNIFLRNLIAVAILILPNAVPVPVAWAPIAAAKAEGPENPIIPTAKRKIIEYSQTGYRNLSAYRIAELHRSVIKEGTHRLQIKHFTVSSSANILRSSFKQRKLTARLLRDMSKLRSQKDRVGYIKREQAKLKKLAKNLRASIKRLKAKNKAKKSKALEDAIREEEERLSCLQPTLLFLFLWRTGWADGRS